MNHCLHNPVYNALLTGDKHLANGTATVQWYDEAVSPFVGFTANNKNGFDELHSLLPEGRKILYAIPSFITQPKGWQVQHEIKGLQFVYEGNGNFTNDSTAVQPLTTTHVAEMIALTKLTRPGPFAAKTILFGAYYGIFENGQLVAMTGQRMHPEDYSEISAVCTHPDYLGKGYASVLIQHQLQLILEEGRKPFLHVRADNERAVALYHRLGFTISRPMNFYFMQKQ